MLGSWDDIFVASMLLYKVEEWGLWQPWVHLEWVWKCPKSTNAIHALLLETVSLPIEIMNMKTVVEYMIMDMERALEYMFIKIKSDLWIIQDIKEMVNFAFPTLLIWPYPLHTFLTQHNVSDVHD
mgnify:CR=1 FL=1